MHPVDPSLITDGSTFINPLGLVFTLTMCVLLVILPRKYALFPILALVCYMTMGMRVMIADLNFTMIRILLVFAWARLLLRGEFRRIQLNTLDKVVIAMTISSLIAYTLLWQTGDAFKWKLGEAYNQLGIYFFFSSIENCFASELMYGASPLPMISGRLWFSITMVNTVPGNFGGTALCIVES